MYHPLVLSPKILKLYQNLLLIHKMSAISIGCINRVTSAAWLITLILLAIGIALVRLNQTQRSKPQTKSSINQTSTWRLLITVDVKTEPYPFTIDDLRVALESKFSISLAKSKGSLAPQGDKHCATLNLPTPISQGLTGGSFDLTLNRSGFPNISLE